MFARVCHGQMWRGIKGGYKNKSEDCTEEGGGGVGGGTMIGNCP